MVWYGMVWYGVMHMLSIVNSIMYQAFQIVGFDVIGSVCQSPTLASNRSLCTYISVTHIWFSVSVPVLSLHTTVAEPSASTAMG